MTTHNDYNMAKEYKNEIEQIDEGVQQPVRPRINSLGGYIEVVSSIPTTAPTNFEQSIKIYVSGGTKRLYLYDTTNNAWIYATLT